MNIEQVNKHIFHLEKDGQGRIQEFVQVGLNFSSFQGVTQHPFGTCKPPEINNFTGPGGGLSPLLNADYEDGYRFGPGVSVKKL